MDLKPGPCDLQRRRKGPVVASQPPLQHRHGATGGLTSADAILDLLAHHTRKITPKGGAMRKNKPDGAIQSFGG